jgi:hypothetical protein
MFCVFFLVGALCCVWAEHVLLGRWALPARRGAPPGRAGRRPVAPRARLPPALLALGCPAPAAAHLPRHYVPPPLHPSLLSFASTFPRPQAGRRPERLRALHPGSRQRPGRRLPVHPPGPQGRQPDLFPLPAAGHHQDPGAWQGLLQARPVARPCVPCMPAKAGGLLGIPPHILLLDLPCSLWSARP